MLDDFQILARGRLLAAQAREPDVVILERRKKRLDFAQLAAAAGIGAIEDSELRFLLGDRLLRGEILQVQIPCFRHAIAIRVRFGEVIAGIEKEHRNLRQALAQQIERRSCLPPGSCR